MRWVTMVTRISVRRPHTDLRRGSRAVQLVRHAQAPVLARGVDGEQLRGGRAAELAHDLAAAAQRRGRQRAQVEGVRVVPLLALPARAGRAAAAELPAADARRV